MIACGCGGVLELALGGGLLASLLAVGPWLRAKFTRKTPSTATGLRSTP